MSTFIQSKGPLPSQFKAMPCVGGSVSLCDKVSHSPLQPTLPTHLQEQCQRLAQRHECTRNSPSSLLLHTPGAVRTAGFDHTGRLEKRSLPQGFCPELMTYEIHYGQTDAWKSAEEYAMLLTLLAHVAPPDGMAAKLLQQLQDEKMPGVFGVLTWCTVREREDLEGVLATLIQPEYFNDAKDLLSHPDRYRRHARVPLAQMMAWQDGTSGQHAAIGIDPGGSTEAPPREVVHAAVVRAEPQTKRRTPQLLPVGVSLERANVFDEWLKRKAAQGRLEKLAFWTRLNLKAHLGARTKRVPNSFGFRCFEAGGAGETLVFVGPKPSESSADGSGNYVVCVDKATLESRHVPDAAPQGTFKWVAGSNKNRVLFLPVGGHTFATPGVDPARYADLRSIVSSTVVAPGVMFARNAGVSLHDHVWGGGIYYPLPKVFGPLVRDLATLHERGLYHLDIKLANLTVTIDPDSKWVRDVSLVDTDGITGVNDNFAFTPGALPYAMYKRMKDACQAFAKGNANTANQAAKAFRTADEYMMLLSMLAAGNDKLRTWCWNLCGCNEMSHRSKNASSTQLPQWLDEIDNWIATNVQPQFRGEIKQLLKNPAATTLSVPLAQVFVW